MEWDRREYCYPFNGIKLTEYSINQQMLPPKTAKIIYQGTDVKLVEGSHIYKIFGNYYLFAAEGGTVYTHQEVVARSEELFGEFETQPGEAFLAAYDSPRNYHQKCGHGSLVETPSGEWYFAHLTGRPCQHKTESAISPRCGCALGRKMPHVVGGKQGAREVEAPPASLHYENLPTILLEDDKSYNKQTVFSFYIE
ncbi:CP4-6 prophage; predicted xylosidase/arabinosidase [Carnobacterium sp. AT7]|uniref:family 43 glycosylhydrolase n=1 Tax=Carnobacterium TaxID=2747 RepID=UPI00015F14A5|nr:CP4-6 prophage; predicted xylosidase/arabinosidase [Carnobacterium sp. AT7]